MPRFPPATTPIDPQWLNRGTAPLALRLMLKIRLTEEAVAREYAKQEMRCPVHLSIGQEGPAVGVSLALHECDQVVSTHRCHAHYLAKGGNLRAMIAELYGKATGCAGGKGGSMHLVDTEVGMMGSSAVLGGTVPLAVGLALSYQLRGESRVAVAYLGDGATEQGVFHEALHFAAHRRLPVIFAVENNGYATLSHIDARRPAHVPIERFAETYGIGGGVELDGSNLGEVYHHANEAVVRARRGGGPSLLVTRAYRWKEHVGPGHDRIPGGRDEEELDDWRRNADPIVRWRDALIRAGCLAIETFDGWTAELNREIDAAFEAARNAPFPPESALGEGV